MTQPRTQPKELQALLAAEPDLVDRIFDYLLTEFPQLAGDAERVERAQLAVRAEFAGDTVYIQKRSSQDIAAEVLRLFNGRNATEVSRRLNIHRATVYRYLKQSAK
jgi:transcriptional regulator of acetoin/glycerol metabolism